jgi:hypothetical protein
MARNDRGPYLGFPFHCYSDRFTADILPGDLVLSIDGRGLFDQETAQQAIAQATGHSAEVVLVPGANGLLKRLRSPPIRGDVPTRWSTSSTSTAPPTSS